MHSISKNILEATSLQKSLGIMDRHLSALQEFEKTHTRLQDIYKDTYSLQSATNSLLATSGISKSLIGLQSVSEQIQASQRMLNMPSIANLSATKALYGMDHHILNQIQASQKIWRDMIDSPVAKLLNEQSVMKQIANQVPLANAMQLRLPQMERVFESASTLAAIANSNSFLSSALSVATTSLNFSSVLDTLNLTEQQRIIDIIDQIDLDDETDIGNPEELPEEIQSEYINFIDFIRDYWKENREHILGILATADTAVNGIANGDFSNIFTIVLFAFYCTNLLNSSTSENDDDQEKSFTLQNLLPANFLQFPKFSGSP